MGFDFDAMIAEGYVFHDQVSTVLAYRLTPQQLALLEKVASRIKVFNFLKRKSPLQVCVCDCVTDLIAIPHCVSFVNFAEFNEEERSQLLSYLNYLQSCDETELPTEDLEDEDWLMETYREPPIYVFNFDAQADEEIPDCFHFEDNLFEQPDKLRLKILAEAKLVEGNGEASTNSNRIYRVLQMYKLLIEQGYLTRKMVEQMLAPDQVSDRMFFRDLEIIRHIENERLVFDRKSKTYQLLKVKS
jgi:hypothetical protein